MGKSSERRIDWNYEVFSKLQNVGDEMFCSERKYPSYKLYPVLTRKNAGCKVYESEKVEGGLIVRKIC